MVSASEKPVVIDQSQPDPTKWLTNTISVARTNRAQSSGDSGCRASRAIRMRSPSTNRSSWSPEPHRNRKLLGYSRRATPLDQPRAEHRPLVVGQVNRDEILRVAHRPSVADQHLDEHPLFGK
jgi:hypothetical protein